MKLENYTAASGHLSYCSNIHAGESWAEVSQNLQRFIPSIRAALAPEQAFGIGLRLSARAAEELSNPQTLKQFQTFLQGNNLYVFTINGFPYGPFHGTRVKEDVYLPDWQDAERLQYSNLLADVFAQLLPKDTVGSISTVPGAFKSRIRTEDDIQNMMHHMVQHVLHLVAIESNTGKVINLALEPEPCCYLETIDESVAFFTQYLFGDAAQMVLVNALGVDKVQALRLLKRHITLCLDLCHAAVEFEDAQLCVQKLRNADIGIGKMQISAGLRLNNVSLDSIALLEPYNDNVYLHQVVERYQGNLVRYSDLSEAFEQLRASGDNDAYSQREWRVHFHVPIFLNELGTFTSTQSFISDILSMHKFNPISDHLEVETYTWGVLPDALRTQSIDKAIVRELQWVLEALS